MSTTLNTGDSIEGNTSGFTATVTGFHTSDTTGDPLVYTAVLSGITGTPTLSEYLIVNGTLTTFQVTGALVTGCSGPTVSGY